MMGLAMNEQGNILIGDGNRTDELSTSFMAEQKPTRQTAGREFGTFMKRKEAADGQLLRE